MAEYSLYSRVRRWPKRILYTSLVLLILLVGSVAVVRRVYDQNLRPVSSSQEQKAFVVRSGASVNEIGSELHQAGLIRQVWAFERYVRNNNLGSKLQAGTYKISPSQSVQSIASMLAEGRVAIDLITLLPGQRLDQLKDEFIRAKFNPAEVEAALNPSQYIDSPALSDKPKDASLEGFLYPDSYQKDASTDPRVIIRASLTEMSERLTPALRQAFAARGLTVYQAITLASIIEREVSNKDDRAQVAQVFYKRLQNGLKLESDVTAFYGAHLDGKQPSVNYDSPYNTYKVTGLPKGPISNVSESSLQAVASPAGTDWLYFVAGDDGKTYFSKTLADHQALTEQHCKKLCDL